MKITKTFKITTLVIISGIAVASGVAFYLFNMPHRDVQATKTDYAIPAKDLINEYLSDADAANDKYLQEEGNSKILAVTGKVFSKTTDQKNQIVILLKDSSDKAGVSCTFTQATNSNAKILKQGQTVTIKGVIRSGAGFDEDLDLYENVIMEKCDIINQ